MAYASTVDTGQAIPWALYDGDLTLGSAIAPTANNAYFVGVFVPSSCVLTGVRTYFGTGGNGNCDLGIYDANGNLLNHQGAMLTASGVFTYTLATPLPLAPGRYYLALFMVSATDTVAARTSANASIGVQQRVTTSTQLPATMSGAANTSFKPTLIGLVQGGWS